MSEQKVDGIEVGAAGVSDLDGIGRLWKSLIDYHHDLDKRHWIQADDGVEKFAEYMGESLQKDDCCLYVASQTGQVVGFIFATLKQAPPVMKPRTSCEISDIVVSDSIREKGVGRSLVDAVKKWAKEKNADDITLIAACKNKSGIAFWEKMGFESWTTQMWMPV